MERGSSASRPRGTLLAAFGAASVVACLAGEVFVVREYLAFPAAPRRATLEEAREGEWVALDAAALDCSTARRNKTDTYVLGRSDAGGAFVALYSGPFACSPRGALTGVVRALGPRLEATSRRIGVPVPDGRVSELCTYCGPWNSGMGIGVLLVLAACGGVLLYGGLKMRRAAAERGSPPAEPAAGRRFNA